jgi:hypothetical protein
MQASRVCSVTALRCCLAGGITWVGAFPLMPLPHGVDVMLPALADVTDNLSTACARYCFERQVMR